MMFGRGLSRNVWRWGGSLYSTLTTRHVLEYQPTVGHHSMQQQKEVRQDKEKTQEKEQEKERRYIPIPTRIDKFLHDGCRQAHEEIIAAWTQGRVKYEPGPSAQGHLGNSGKFMSDIFVFADDVVLFDGKPITFRDPATPVRCLAMHKPKGVAMEKVFDSREIRRRAHERARVAELRKMGHTEATIDRQTALIHSLMEKIPPGFFPVGRLDKDTTGLLLLTNCGDLGNFLTTPGKYVKEYECEITQPYSAELHQPRIETLLSGIPLRPQRRPGQRRSYQDDDDDDDGGDDEEEDHERRGSSNRAGRRGRGGHGDEDERGPAKVQYARLSGSALTSSPAKDLKLKSWTLTVGILEGRNRVVRRMLGAARLPLGKLHRTKIGCIDIFELALLRPTATTELTPAQIQRLWDSVYQDPLSPDARSPQQQIIDAKIAALQRHAQYLRSPKVNHPNTRLETWLAQQIEAYPHLSRLS